MASKKRRFETWLTLFVLAVGLVITAIAGLFIYVSATAPTLHPSAQDVKSISAAAPVQQWAGAVERARQSVRATLAEQNLPGVSIAVGAAGEIVWAEGFGFADLDKKTTVGPETLFRIGTMSTVLTSAAAGMLIEKDRLALDEKIQTYVPEFPEKQWPVTVRLVMGHVAGIRNDSGDEGPLYGSRCGRPIEALEYFKDGSLLFEPGTQYRYSSYGWILMSAAVEAAADQPFLSFMRSQIFEPLGMTHTEADSATEEIPDRATPYFPRFGGDPKYGPDPMRPVDYSCYFGASIFLSTPSDLVRFALAVNGGKLLQLETLKLLQTPQRLSSGQETGYGLGWDIETVTLAGQPTRWVGHDGTSLGGMIASLMTFPERGLAVAITSNTSYADTESLALKVAEAFAEQTPAPPK